MSTLLKVDHTAFNSSGEMLTLETSLVGTVVQENTTPEVQLLLACAPTVIDDATAERIRILLRGNLDWMFIIEQAEQHRVMPLLCRSLNEVGSDLVPPAVLKDLRDCTTANAHFNLYRTGQLIKLLRLFESNGIPALPFKGPVLSASAYGDLGLRQYADLDILVRPLDVIRTKALLLGQGYELTTALAQMHEVDLSRRRKDLIFDSADGRVRVELHWRLTGSHFDFPLDLDWDRLDSVSLAGATVRTLDPEDLLLYLCMHGSRHGWERLLWLCDVAELLRMHPNFDWESVTNRARKLGSKGTLALGLVLTKELLGLELPPEVWRRVEVEPGTEVLASRLRESLFQRTQGNRGISYWHGIHLRMRERLSDRLRLHLHYYRRYLRLALVPNERDHAMAELPATFSFLYYLLRPFRLLRRFGITELRKCVRR